ncbi:CC157 protein, partial [Rhinopomastus cyanomelas]|nr:CC157 protein [Rhinopomastus cyanomelas]
MAHLLGHPRCIQSLQADLRDLQAAIADVASHTGAALFHSWKFPDKVSWELDMEALLQLYSYTQDEPQFNQHSHVVLLELLVDRLLLLLQSFTGYAENLLSEGVVHLEQKVGPSMSAGLTTRRYWYSMLKLGTSYQQLLSERKAGRKETPTPQSACQAGTPEQQHLKQLWPDILNQRSSTKPLCSPLCPAAADDALSSSVPRAACNENKSTCSTSIQAMGSLLGACNSCTSAQASLSEVGKSITSICQSQNIPSALAKFQEVLKVKGRTILSETDLSYWASEQSKDLSRISKHLQMLVKQITPLKEALKQSEKQKNDLQKQVEDLSQLLQVEKTSKAQQRKKAEESLEMKTKEHLETVARLEQDKDNLQRAKGAVPFLSPEVSKKTLAELMRTTMVSKSQVLELEEKVQQLMRQCESLGQELITTSITLEKEKAKVESMQRHEESMQAKSNTLQQQLGYLAQECEELQASLGEAEEDKARLAEELKQSQEQNQEQQSVVELQANVCRLEQQALELKERERLLMLFPELHAPAHTQTESTGSLSEDMEKQLQANSLRISTLEQENKRLSSALTKLKEAASKRVLK